MRELVLGAIDSDHLVRQHGVWRLVGALVATPRLQEVVATRLAALPPTAADALDRLAVWEPTGLSPLEDVVGRDQLELLDRAGLLTVRADGRRQTVTLAHPLYGEILRARMPALVRRRLLLEHADCLDAHGARRREDPLRAATARLEVSGSAELGLLVRAARLARYGQDFTQVERLGRAALGHGMTPEVGLLVGEALHELGSFAEADEVLTAAEASVTDADPLLVHITEIRSRNLVWGLFRGDEALAVNRSARDRLGDGPGVEELTLNEASLLSYCGRPLDALALLESMPHTADPRARALRAMAEVPALVATGRCATGAATAVRAYAEQMELPDQIALPGPDVHIGNQIHALTECGRLNDAAALATAAYEATPSTAPPDALVWLSHQLGRCALLSGRVETARRWLGESLARCDAHNIIGPSRLVLSALATAHASLGDAAAAAAAVLELDRRPAFLFDPAEQELGRAWALVATGDLPGARDVLRAAAELAIGERISDHRGVAPPRCRPSR